MGPGSNFASYLQPTLRQDDISEEKLIVSKTERDKIPEKSVDAEKKDDRNEKKESRKASTREGRNVGKDEGGKECRKDGR